MSNPPDNRTVRVFLSSTFRDFAEERDLLVRKVFPELRRKCRERQVELVDVDLRWGITEKEAQQGKVLPICLAEIDRARPYFIGFLGERYGWIPASDQYDPSILQEQPWLVEHRGGKSVTELEILHGVLNDPAMAGRAFFYFRDPKYSRAKGGVYLGESSEEEAKLNELKGCIRQSSFPVVEKYKNPAALAERVRADLWKLIDEAFPVEEIPDALAMERRRHEAYGASLLGMYLGGRKYFTKLDRAIHKTHGFKPVLITGESGGGKSALVANWMQAHAVAHPKTLTFVHHLGAGADAADPLKLVTRLLREISRVTGEKLQLESEPQKIFDLLPEWLARASAHAQKHHTNWLLIFDGLDKLSSLRDLRWWPGFLPQGIKLICSCLDGEVKDTALKRMKWTELGVCPLGKTDQATFIKDFLAKYRKSLTRPQLAQVLAHPLSGNPLFLKTLLEELRVFGVLEKLDSKIIHYLNSQSIDDLFEKVLERIEEDAGKKPVRAAMEAIWASRAGLAQDELLAIAKLKPAAWATIHNALDEALIESSGRITFSHDYMRKAVEDRYLFSKKSQNMAHTRLAEWFDSVACDEGVDNRIIEELPWQQEKAGMKEELLETLADQAMFIGLYNKDKYELLKYWLSLKEDFFYHYEEAWKEWISDADDELELSIAGFRLAEFLRELGSVSPFVGELYKQSQEAIRSSPDSNKEDGLAAENSVGLFQLNMGKFSDAEMIFRRCVSESENLLGRNHPDTLDEIGNLALSLYRQDKNEESSQLYAETLRERLRIFGENHPKTITSLIGSANLAYAMGEHDKAIELNERALESSEKIFGMEHPQIFGILNNRGHILRSQGDYGEAVALYRRALNGFAKVLGEEHPNTLMSVICLAKIHQTTGDLEEAELLYRRALDGQQKSLGSEHPTTLTNIASFSDLLRVKGKYEEAEAMMRRVIQGREKIFGCEHLITLVSYRDLGNVLHAMEKYGETERLYRGALKGLERVMGTEDPQTLTTVSDLGVLLSDINDFEEARTFHQRALTGREKMLGSEHPATLNSIHNIGNLLCKMCDYEGSEKMHLRALTGRMELLGSDHPSTLASVNSMAVVMGRLGRISEAVELLKERSLQSPKARRALLYNLACCECRMGHHEEAKNLITEHLAIHPEMKKKSLDDPDFTAIHGWISSLTPTQLKSHEEQNE
jgi:tetratricopeptide (TPR) repeat protein